MLQSPTGMTIAAMMKLIYLTYFNAGLRVYNIRDPLLPVENGWFIPPQPKERAGALPRDLVTQTEDVHLDMRGYTYVTDRGVFGSCATPARINPRRLINDDARQHAFLAGDDAKPVVLDFMKRERGENAPADLRDLN